MDYEEIKRLIQPKQEQVNVEFKAGEPFEGDFRFRIAKGIAAMANNELGGVILVGVDDNGAITGVDTDRLATYKDTEVLQFVNRQFEPPVSAVLHHVDCDGKTVVAIEVKEFEEDPHVARSAGNGEYVAGDIIVRGKENKSTKANHERVRNVLARAMWKKREDLIANLSRVFTGALPAPDLSDEATVQRQNESDILEREDEVSRGLFQYGRWTLGVRTATGSPTIIDVKSLTYEQRVRMLHPGRRSGGHGMQRFPIYFIEKEELKRGTDTYSAEFMGSSLPYERLVTTFNGSLSMSRALLSDMNGSESEKYSKWLGSVVQLVDLCRFTFLATDFVSEYLQRTGYHQDVEITFGADGCKDRVILGGDPFLLQLGEKCSTEGIQSQVVTRRAELAGSVFDTAFRVMKDFLEFFGVHEYEPVQYYQILNYDRLRTE